METLALAKRLDIDSHFNTMMPYPGTKVREEALLEGRLKPSFRYLDFNPESSFMSTKYLTLDDVKLVRKLLVYEFALHRLWKAARSRAVWASPASAFAMGVRLLHAWWWATILHIKASIIRSRIGQMAWRRR
jgi:hypothetical protein